MKSMLEFLRNEILHIFFFFDSFIVQDWDKILQPMYTLDIRIYIRIISTSHWKFMNNKSNVTGIIDTFDRYRHIYNMSVGCKSAIFFSHCVLILYCYDHLQTRFRIIQIERGRETRQKPRESHGVWLTLCTWLTRCCALLYMMEYIYIYFSIFTPFQETRAFHLRGRPSASLACQCIGWNITSWCGLTYGRRAQRSCLQ